MKSMLVATENGKACDTIRECFAPEYKVDTASDKDSCLDKFTQRRYDFTFIDLELLRESSFAKGHYDYTAALHPFREAFPTAEIIVMSSQDMIREAVMAVKAGSSNYLTYPIDKEEAQYVVQSLYESLRMESELHFLRDTFWQADSLEFVHTNSPVMREIFEKVRAVAPTRSTVLLTGETGTGKGIVAKLIHGHSHRREKQFISTHCGAIPDTLVESELFGHEKGAFTGAVRRKLGKFELAHGGTIFLDEIGTITPSAQIKLLEVLQEKSFQRVGGEARIEVDVRIVAATNTDLRKMTDQGLFRNDLYYRLGVFPIEIPPLRERREDIPLISRHILKKLNKFHPKEIQGIHPRVLEAFERYSWPGNIRELENLIERAYILETSSILTPESFPSELFMAGDVRAQLPPDTALTLSEVRRRGIETIERQYLQGLLTENEGRIGKTAQAAGISARQLHKLMTKYGVRKEDFKEQLPRR
jgi:DNA-binding NtrC family response regulator